jgi:hypothetical protein
MQKRAKRAWVSSVWGRRLRAGGLLALSVRKLVARREEKWALQAN